MALFHRYAWALLRAVCVPWLATAQIASLPVTPLDVKYSAPLDRLIIISKSPHQLSVVNPATGASSFITLPKEPTSLSVSPDGLYAAVGHDTLVTYINLTTAAIEKSFAVSIKVNGVLLAGNGWVHAFPGRSINIASGIQSAFDALRTPADRATLHPNGQWVYYTGTVSQIDLIKADLSGGAFQYLYDSKYDGDFNICGGVWIMENGQRIITACATLFRTSSQQSEDMIYSGGFSATQALQSAVHSSAMKKIAVIPGFNTPFYTGADKDTEVQFYDDQYIAYQGKIQLPEISAGVPWHGRYIFAAGGGMKMYVVMQPDLAAGTAVPYGVYSLSITPTSSCSATLSATTANVPASGGDTTVNVIATPGCVWESSTAANWAFVSAGALAAGNSSVTIRAAPNLQTNSRTTAVTIAGQTFTITQAAAAAAGGDISYVLPFRPVAADYTATLDRMVIASESPSSLHIFDPVSRAGQVVSLTLPPTAVSVSPDGLFAAVGHNGWLSYVNLTAATVEKFLPVSADVFRVALSASHAYVFPRRAGWQPLRVLTLATGADASWNGRLPGATGGRISPDGRYLHVNDTKRYDLSGGIPSQAYDGSTGCYDLWFTQDSLRAFTNCGTVVAGTPAGETVGNTGVLWNNARTQAVAHSSGRKVVAAVQAPGTTVPGYPTTGLEDTAIRMFSEERMLPYELLTTVGEVAIPKKQVGPTSVTMRGRYLFWNNSATRLFVIGQGDASAGVLFDYDVYTLSVDGQCSVSFPSPTTAVAANEFNGTLTVNAPAGCLWFASSNASWVTLTQGVVGAGNGSVVYHIAANIVPTARTATISIAGQTFTITQAAGSPSAAGPTNVVPFRVVDAEYSYALDRLIAVSDNPKSLNIYDPATLQNTSVALASAPTALSLSPDGLRAAVGHYSTISIVNLQTGALEKTLPVTINDVHDVALGSNNWVYASATGGSGTAVSVNIGTGQEHKQYLDYRGVLFRIHPSGKSLYAGEVGSYPNDIDRFSIADGPMKHQYDSPYHGEHPICGPLWLMNDTRLITACGTVFRTSEVQTEDIKYAGRFSGMTSTIGASHAPAHNLVAFLPTPAGTAPPQVALYNDQLLSLKGTVELPNFPVPGATIKSVGRHVFWNKAADRIYVVLQAASSVALNDFALHTVSPEHNTGCTISLGSTSAAVTAAGTSTGSVPVIASAGCVWQAKSNAPWIRVTVGQFAVGLGNVEYSVDASASPVPRTGTITVNGQTLTITQGAADPTACMAAGGCRFVPVTPCRIADTRNPNGPFGGPAIVSGTPRNFAVPSSACSIPPTALAYSINVTVVPRGLLGYLTVWPAGQPFPLASTLNSLDGRVKANAAIVPAGSGGAISIAAMHTTDVILDINGYFVSSSTPSSLTFYPLTPCRLIDTRFGTGPLGGPALSAAQQRSIPVRSSSCGVPATAQAYSLNFTAIPRGFLGHISAWPTGGAMPTVSTLNATTGQITANAAVVPAGTNGHISVFATNETDLLVDINGYFAPAGAGGLSLYSTIPCRALDTREPAGSAAFNGIRNISLAGGSCGLPASGQAYVAGATVVPSGLLGHLTLWPQGQSQPTASTLNALDGLVTSNMAIVPATNGSISGFATNATHLVLDISGYFAP